MRRNEVRRKQLLDAAIVVLAQEGSRGLSYRAVDAAAELPTGTASNYFNQRTSLLQAVAKHLHSQLAPDSVWLKKMLMESSGLPLLKELLVGLVQRVTARPMAFRALLELRLEAARQPELQKVLSGIFISQFAQNQKFTAESGFDLTQTEFELLYVAMSGLLIELVTSPGTIKSSPEELVSALISRMGLPDS